MLTGDKLETATCTAKNAHLITRNQDIHIFRPVSPGNRPVFLLCTYLVGNSWFYSRADVSSKLPWQFLESVNPRASRLCDQGPLASGHTAQHNYACRPSQQPQLNKSPPTSESIQATVKENKQPFAQTEEKPAEPLPEGTCRGLTS